MRTHSDGPPIEDLRTFLHLIELGDLEAVARRLGVNRSTVSRRLRRFRGQYQLISKHGGGMVITDRGNALAPIVRAAVREYDRMLAALTVGRTAASVAVATGPYTAAYVLPDAVARYAATCPTGEVLVQIARGRDRVRGLTDGRYDVAVVPSSAARAGVLTEFGLTSAALSPLPFVVAARRGTPSAAVLTALPREAEVGPTELRDVVLVGLDARSEMRQRLEARAAVAGVSLRFGVSGGGWLSARGYARHGLGVAVLPAGTLEEADWPRLVVRMLSPSLASTDYLLMKSECRPEVSAFVTQLGNVAEAHAHRLQTQVEQAWKS